MFLLSNMGLMEKIEAIRRKPEHIRRRYVLFFVFLSAIFIIILWLFSFQANSLRQIKRINSADDLQELANQFEEQKKSMQDTVSNIKKSVDQNSASRMQDNSIK